MSKATQCAKVVDLAETRATRLLAEVRETLVPADADAAFHLAQKLAGDLARHPDSLLRHRVAVAAHDLEDVIAMLQAELDGLANELRAVNRHTTAATAYSRAADAGRSL